MSSKPLYKRILLKLSGEALQGEGDFGFDPKVFTRLTNEIAQLMKSGVQVAIVLGGGNLFRGSKFSMAGIDRVTVDHMGMLGTIMNVVALRDMLNNAGIPTRAMSAIPLEGIIEPVDRLKAIRQLEKGRVVLFAGGTGNPLVTTDSTASLRAIEIKADVLLKATNVNGVYDKDPTKHKDAKLYTHLSFKEALDKELAVMDLTSFYQCRDNHLPIRVFNINLPNILQQVLTDANIGTTVK